MIKILQLLAGPFVAPALLAGLLLSAGGLGLTWWHLHQANNTIEERDQTIAELKTELAQSKLETAQTQKAMADFHAQVERDRADTNAKTLADERALQAQIANLASQVAVKERARRAASDDLLKVLHAVPLEQQNVLSPAVRDALLRVRVAQGVDPPDASAPGSPGGGPNENRIPSPAPAGGSGMPP